MPLGCVALADVEVEDRSELAALRVGADEALVASSSKIMEEAGALSTTVGSSTVEDRLSGVTREPSRSRSGADVASCSGVASGMIAISWDDASDVISPGLATLRPDSTDTSEAITPRARDS